MGSLTSPQWLGITSHPGAPRICLWRGLHAYPRTTIAWAELPSCVTPSLTYYPIGPTARPERNPKAPTRIQGLCIRGFSVGAYQRVREYQPVVHRLRLSASP